MILKLESSASSTVVTSLEASMPLHQPTTFSFPKHQVSKSKLVACSFQASLFHSWTRSYTDHYIIMRSQMIIVILPFAFYVCAMASREKMSSGNANTAFISNCDHNYNYMARIQSIAIVVFQCINMLHSIMKLMLLWISKRLLKNGTIVTI